MGKKFGFTFSWKRASGISGIRSSLAQRIGVPTSRGGIERKIGKLILDLFFKKR
jgi:hypothetical protein